MAVKTRSLKDEILYNIRITPEQKDWLVKEAKRLDRPVAWIIRDLIDRAMGKGPPPTA